MPRTVAQRKHDLDVRQLAQIKNDLLNGVPVDPQELAAFGIRRNDVPEQEDDSDEEDDDV